MSMLDLSRWQFGITTVYHFIFVPLTIGLSILVAAMQTAWFVKKDQAYLRMTKFFGKLFLINFAVGVVTGIVLEFQFGMNWSAYSRFVGDVFGAPLAMEGLLAFFMESVFLGLWIFGWDKLSPRLHLATIWLAAIGTNLSAFFILAANSWMQHPVGYRVNPVTHRAELTSIVRLLTNSTVLAAWPHVILASFVTAGMVLIAASAWHLARRSDTALFRRVMRLGLTVTLIAGLATFVTGDIQARLMDSQQPMKMAAAEALYNTQNGASFSLLTIGNLSGQPVFQIRVPHLLSLIADMSWNGQVVGINQMQAAEVAKYGAGNYAPILWMTYWSFRAMVGAGILMIGVSAWGVWLWWRKRLAASRWFRRAAVAGIVLPIIANASGWIFTEAGRQPWIVYGLMQTAKGVSTVGAGDVALTTAVFVAVYTILAVLAVVLVLRAARHPFDEIGEPPADADPLPAPGLVY